MYDNEIATVTVAGSNGRTIRTTVEEVRHTLHDDSFAEVVRQAIDKLGEDVQDALSTLNTLDKTQ